MTRVDLHAHCFPARYLERLAARGDASAAGLGALRGGDGADEVAVRLETMDRAGVDMQVLSISGGLGDADDAREARATARLGNDLLSELVGRHPDRLSAFAALPLPHVDAALAEIERVLDTHEFVGVCVPSSVTGRSVADPEFEPLFEELDRRAAVMFIHPAGVGADSRLIVDRALDWPIGAIVEDTIVVTHLLARDIPRRFPRLRIVNAHLGGAVPMLARRLDTMLARVAPDMAEPASLGMRRMWYDTVCHAHAPALEVARATVGADRLVLGSDYPFVRGDGYTAAVGFVSAAGLPDADVHAILAGNAAIVLDRDQAGGDAGSRSEG